MNITVIGAGSMGCAIAALPGWRDYGVTLCSSSPDRIKMLREQRENLQRLPGIKLPDNISFENEADACSDKTDAVILTCSAQKTRETCIKLSKNLKSSIPVITCSKGIEEGSGKLLTQVIGEVLPGNPVAALSGPSHAEEIAKKIPTAVVAAARDIRVAEKVQNLFMSPTFRVYTNTDITGVELAAALKNVIALCSGISDGLGFGDNTKAALMTRAMAEITRLGVAMGANRETFFGLAGIGDLIVTCTSMHSRNRRAGILIGKGMSVSDALKEVKMVVEGYSTTPPAHMLGGKMNVELPIINKAYEILYQGGNAREAVMQLLQRERKSE